MLVIAAVALSPFWAPAVAPLLPWGRRPQQPDYDALAARVAALEQRPVPPPVDVDPIKSAQAALGQRVAAMEAAVDALRQNKKTAASGQGGAGAVDQRVDAIEAQSASHNADAAAAIQKMQQSWRSASPAAAAWPTALPRSSVRSMRRAMPIAPARC